MSDLWYLTTEQMEELATRLLNDHEPGFSASPDYFGGFRAAFDALAEGGFHIVERNADVPTGA